MQFKHVFVSGLRPPYLHYCQPDLVEFCYTVYLQDTSVCSISGFFVISALSSTRSLRVARIADHIGCHLLSRSSKVDDFHLISKGVWNFLLVINSNLGPFLRYGHLQLETFHSKLRPNRCRWRHGYYRKSSDGAIVNPLRLTV